MKYQSIVDDVRRREDFFAQFNGGGWPGHHSQACSRYPNLAAELSAREWEISTTTRAALVSREVMAGVIEDGDELTLCELIRISERIGVSAPYLGSPVLSLVDPLSNKGKARRRKLEDLLHQAGVFGLRLGQPGVNARKTLETMQSGNPVTYAAYSWAVRVLNKGISEYQEKRVYNGPVRTERRTTA